MCCPLSSKKRGGNPACGVGGELKNRKKMKILNNTHPQPICDELPPLFLKERGEPRLRGWG